MSQFKLKDIANHNTKGSAWISIHNKVYDLTGFMQEHPGGEEVLLDVLGANATESFEEVGHSEDARTLLSKFLIGELHPSDCTEWIKKPEEQDKEIDNEIDGDGNRMGAILILSVVLMVAGILYLY